MEDFKDKAQICACPEISEATTEYLSRDLAQLVLVNFRSRDKTSGVFLS